MPSLSINYGGEWNNRFEGNRKRYDIDDIEWLSGNPNVTLFADYVDSGGITYRFDARNATGFLSRAETLGKCLYSPR